MTEHPTAKRLVKSLTNRTIADGNWPLLRAFFHLEFCLTFVLCQEKKKSKRYQKTRSDCFCFWIHHCRKKLRERHFFVRICLFCPVSWYKYTVECFYFWVSLVLELSTIYVFIIVVDTEKSTKLLIELNWIVSREQSYTQTISISIDIQLQSSRI